MKEYVGMDRKTIARRLSPGATNRDNAARSARYHAKKQQEARAQ